MSLLLTKFWSPLSFYSTRFAYKSTTITTLPTILRGSFEGTSTYDINLPTKPKPCFPLGWKQTKSGNILSIFLCYRYFTIITRSATSSLLLLLLLVWWRRWWLLRLQVDKKLFYLIFLYSSLAFAFFLTYMIPFKQATQKI